MEWLRLQPFAQLWAAAANLADQVKGGAQCLLRLAFCKLSISCAHAGLEMIVSGDNTASAAIKLGFLRFIGLCAVRLIA